MKRHNFFRRLLYAVGFCIASTLAISVYVYSMWAAALFIANWSDGTKSTATEKAQTLDKAPPAPEKTPTLDKIPLEPPQSEAAPNSPAANASKDARLLATNNQKPAISPSVLKSNAAK